VGKLGVWRLVWLACATLGFLAVVMPPWRIIRANAYQRFTIPDGYHFIFYAPDMGEIDIVRLLVQLLPVTVFGLYAAWKDGVLTR